MALSGTRTFLWTRDDIITQAYRDINVLGLGDVVTSDMKTEAADLLITMMLSWQNADNFPWTYDDTSLSLGSGTASYTLGSTIIAVRNVFFRDADGNDTHLEPMTKESYQDITDKDSAGRPTSYYVDYQLAAPILYLYPVYDSTDGTVGYTRVYRFQDFTDGSTNPDLPARWYRAIHLNLAVDLAPAWNKNQGSTFTNLVGAAAAARNEARVGNAEIAAIQFHPRMR